MTARSSLPSVARTLFVLTPICLGSFLLAGCTQDGYPTYLDYPMRSDPIVVGKPEKDAPALDRPGDFPKVLFPYLTDEERGKLVVDPATIAIDQRLKLHQTLTEIFGTPAEPRVESPSEDIKAALEDARRELRLDNAILAEGARLYRQQCLHCHGLTGDGRGPTAPWVNPHPRDYRQGRFKFTSSSQDEGRRKPRRGDIYRTIEEGIESTSMPSFRLLARDELEALTSYVIYLSMRGEVEFAVLSSLAKKEEYGVNDYVPVIAKNWLDAQKAIIDPDTVPPPTPTEAQRRESVQNGYRLFIQQGGAGCISCHTDYGRQSAYKYDAWGTITRPIDLTTGYYRGGRRPIDLFWRIHSGINGTGMTAFGSQLSAKDIWDIVAFLQVLPYPAMREKYGIKLEAN